MLYNNFLGRSIHIDVKVIIVLFMFLILGKENRANNNLAFSGGCKSFYEQVSLPKVDTLSSQKTSLKLPTNYSTQEKLFGLSKIWSEAKYNFVNIDKLDFDLDSLYNTYIPKVIASPNDYEYYQLLQRFVASLKDGHTEVFSNGQFNSKFRDYIPLLFQDFNKKIYITSIRTTSDLDSTYIGAELIEVRGMPTAKYLKNHIFPYISASTEQRLWMQSVYKLHSGFKDQFFRGRVKKKDGTIKEIKLKFDGEATRTPEDKSWGITSNWPEHVVELDWKGDIAVIGIHAFSSRRTNLYEAIDSVMNIAKNAKGLIIDLRRNGGGSTEVAWHLQKYFTKGDHFLNFAWETRINDGVGKANGNWIKKYEDHYLNKALRFEKPESIEVSDTLERVKCPAAILIGRYTFSAAEDFLVNMYEVKDRPLLIGEPTGGSTGSPLFFGGLPGGGSARICTRRVCFPISSKPFVNQGIEPDIVVKPDIDDFLNERDVVLEKSIEEIKKLSKD
ncbi:MAG: S41 family peptidase [Hyphomicrobiales bacterium]